MISVDLQKVFKKKLTDFLDVKNLAGNTELYSLKVKKIELKKQLLKLSNEGRDNFLLER